MSTRRKSKQQNDSTPIDEKEHADRIAAAEAMSCLSSMVVLPSNSEELFALSGNLNVTSSENVQSGKNKARLGASNANKKGKTRNRSTKNSPTSAPAKKSQAIVDKNLTQTNKQKQKAQKYAPNLAVPNKKPNKLPDQVLSLTINPRNPNHEQKKAEVAKIQTSVPEQETDEKVIQPPVLTPAFVHIDHSTGSSVIQIDHNKPGCGLHNLSSNDLNKILAGKLPFQVKSDSAEAQEFIAKHVASRIVNLASTESVELSQSAVENILSHMALKQKVDSKESSESSLPLKKRRLQGFKEDDPHAIGDGSEKSTEQDSVKPEGPGTSFQQERVNPVAVDPSTSLMLLNEMQVALQQDEDGDLPLHIAVVHENIVMVQKFVHLMSISGKSVDKYNKAQQTPLHIAVELNFIQAVHTLLLAGSNPNLVNKSGENCIHMAVKANSLDCLQLIFKYHSKPDVNARNFDGLAPIHVSVRKNNIDIVKFLLAERADVNIQDGKSGRTPLFYAVEGNILPMVELFQKVGANLDLPNYASVTAVMAAQARGFHEIASVLLRCMDSKAYLEMKEKEKGTPLRKMPIPRIPSKSHLIQNSECRPSIVDFQQLANSDSNDSTQSSFHSRKRTKSTDVKKDKESANTEKDMKIEKTAESGIQEGTKELITPVQKLDNEGILIPRELLERLQNTMLSLLSMQKGQITPGISNVQTSSTATSQGTTPVQSSTGNLSLASILQNAITTNHTKMISSSKAIETVTSKNSNTGTGTVNSGGTSNSAKMQNFANVKEKDNNKTRHAMLQQLLNVKNSDLDKPFEKKQHTSESNRTEEPMDVSESVNNTDNSQTVPTKLNKNQGVGHAAMNQLGRVTSVSSSLQATLLQMLQAKQNKPLNLSTSKESGNTS